MELVPVDLADIEDVASDSSFVAAIVGPGADGSVVAEAGVPTVSVSTAGTSPSAGPWRRLVAPMGAVADAMAAELETTTACVLSEDPAPDALAGLVADRLGV